MRSDMSVGVDDPCGVFHYLSGLAGNQQIVVRQVFGRLNALALTCAGAARVRRPGVGSSAC
jgi:hypothetical protein